jgi:hypothetical protein
VDGAAPLLPPERFVLLDRRAVAADRRLGLRPRRLYLELGRSLVVGLLFGLPLGPLGGREVLEERKGRFIALGREGDDRVGGELVEPAGGPAVARYVARAHAVAGRMTMAVGILPIRSDAFSTRSAPPERGASSAMNNRHHYMRRPAYCRCRTYANICSMVPARVRLITTANPELVERLRDRLARDGDPPIRMHVDGGELVLSADTAPTMLRSRVLVALEDVAGEQGSDWFRFSS